MAERKRMFRCECQEMLFQAVLQYAQRHDLWDFDELCRRVGCGQICTACHDDMRHFLEQYRPSEAPVPVCVRPAGLPALIPQFYPVGA